jgi:hypothetical protein
MNETFPQRGRGERPAAADDGTGGASAPGAGGGSDGAAERAEDEVAEDESGFDDPVASPSQEANRSSERRALEPALTPEELETRLGLLPARPGCYIFRDRRGEVLYVGKAKSLRSRVRSYF